MLVHKLPVAETHVRGEAAVGALGAELGREEEGLPDGRACGLQGHRLAGAESVLTLTAEGSMHRNYAAVRFWNAEPQSEAHGRGDVSSFRR